MLVKSKMNLQIARDRINQARINKSFTLNLSCLNLETIPDDISDLVHLIDLDLSYNLFMALPREVATLRDLKYLNISNNRISNINFIDGIYYLLEKLNFSNNLLFNIPDSIQSLQNCEEIIFFNNPFLGNLPLSLQNYDLRYIQEYFNLSNYKEKVRFYETKLIFVGRGEVGKTTLMKVLKDSRAQIIQGEENTTHGINIDEMDLDVFFPASAPHYENYNEIDDVYNVHTKEEVTEYDIEYDYEFRGNYYSSFSEPYSNMDDNEKFEIINNQNLGPEYAVKKTVKTNLWDFGGQEIYHSTHQFFLTKRSIYIFVWEPRRDGIEEEFEYWLNIIKFSGENSPVLVVMNKSETRFVSIDEKKYREFFPNIFDFYQVSCITKIGISTLKSSIVNCIQELPHLGEELPKSWIDIRNKLSILNKDFINITDFTNLCKEKINNYSPGHLEKISDYLHDVGAIIHFKSSPILSNIIIINPKWATKAVYSLIDAIPIQKNYGVFKYSDVENILDLCTYPVETHIQLLELMEKFEICFKAVGSVNQYIIPELLKNEIPNNQIVTSIHKNPEAFTFRFKFDFMPAGIISRLICKLFYLLNSKNYWKNGVVFNYESSDGLIVSDTLSKTISVHIVGESKRDLYGLIKNELVEIFKIFNLSEGINYFEEIPCNCQICTATNQPFYFKNSVLRSFIEKDKDTIDCYNSALSVNINDLLGIYKNINSKKKMIYDIILALSKLQGFYKAILPLEDSRNTFISNELSHSGLVSKDQSRWGMSASGKSMGEIDVKIETIEGRPLTFYEGMNLEYLNRSTISSHIVKVINKYDTLGIPEKFIGCYCTCDNFGILAKNYFQYLEDYYEGDISFTNVIDVTTSYAENTEIKVFKSFYFKSERKISLVHILVNLP